MKTVRWDGDGWTCECRPEDGGRIAKLAWQGLELLTKPGPVWQGEDVPEFERRPVFGYDDCFPSVAADPEQNLPDHGRCWSMSADCTTEPDGLRVVFAFPDAITLERRMRFLPHRLAWDFVIRNESEADFPCQHVMHGLMPPSLVRQIELPPFREAVEGLSDIQLRLDPVALAEHIVKRPSGSAGMFLLRDIGDGFCRLTLDNASRLLVRFPRKLFPTLGIWWSRGGYPPGPAAREEFAIEPIPGPSGDFRSALVSRSALCVEAKTELSWQVEWQMSP